MNNPWEKIKLDDYENHMSFSTVNQLQTLNSIMKNQIEKFDVSTVMIMGIAGGNGLNHITDNIDTVYGIDVNQNYLSECKLRYSSLADRLVLLNADLSKKNIDLPHADLIIADLFVEYIGCKMFSYYVSKGAPEYVSVVLQNEGSVNKLVSDTPYSDKLMPAESVYTKITDKELTAELNKISYEIINTEKLQLPNGKEFEVLFFKTYKQKLI